LILLASPLVCLCRPRDIAGRGRRGTSCRRTLLLLAALLSASIELAHSSQPPALIERPNTNAGPTQISTEIWAIDISSIDSAQQSFIADAAVVLQWKVLPLIFAIASLAIFGKSRD
jgi:hypothetical protein